MKKQYRVKKDTPELKKGEILTYQAEVIAHPKKSAGYYKEIEGEMKWDVFYIKECVESQPEWFEEVTQFIILSFIDKENQLWSLIKNGYYSCDASTQVPHFTFTLEKMLKGDDVTVESGAFKIHSVRRENDGEIFTVGDNYVAKWNHQYALQNLQIATIKEIKLINQEIKLYSTGGLLALKSAIKISTSTLEYIQLHKKMFPEVEKERTLVDYGIESGKFHENHLSYMLKEIDKGQQKLSKEEREQLIESLKKIKYLFIDINPKTIKWNHIGPHVVFKFDDLKPDLHGDIIPADVWAKALNEFNHKYPFRPIEIKKRNIVPDNWITTKTIIGKTANGINIYRGDKVWYYKLGFTELVGPVSIIELKEGFECWLSEPDAIKAREEWEKKNIILTTEDGRSILRGNELWLVRIAKEEIDNDYRDNLWTARRYDWGGPLPNITITPTKSKNYKWFSNEKEANQYILEHKEKIVLLKTEDGEECFEEDTVYGIAIQASGNNIWYSTKLPFQKGLCRNNRVWFKDKVKAYDYIVNNYACISIADLKKIGMFDFSIPFFKKISSEPITNLVKQKIGNIGSEKE